MSFKFIMKLALQGYRIRKDYWKQGQYIVLKENGFYNEHNELYIIDDYEDNWELCLKGN